MARIKLPARSKQLGGIQGIANEHARQLVTIGPDHDFWKRNSESVEALTRETVSEGALVRLYPPSDVGAEGIERAREFVSRIAKGVRVMPTAPRGAVPVQEVEASGSPGAREVITAMANEVPSVDRKALVELCEEIMVEVKL